MNVAVTIEVMPDRTLNVYTPYNSEFVTEFKERVAIRAWVPDHPKHWTCRRHDLETVRELCKKWFGACQVTHINDGKRGTSQSIDESSALRFLYRQMPEDLGKAFQTLHMLPTCPLEVADAVFKVYAKHSHPDHGGDGEVFQKQREAINTIRRYLK